MIHKIKFFNSFNSCSYKLPPLPSTKDYNLDMFVLLFAKTHFSHVRGM